MNKEYKPGLGKAIINGIIKDGLVRAETEGLCVWSYNADEIIESIVEDWNKNSQLCQNCESWCLEYSRNSEGIVTCFNCEDKSP